MLQYLGSGWRDYRKDPVWPHARGRWEFQAFLRGAAVLMRGDGGSETARERVLYVSAPECSHGWMGNGEFSEVAVFHFAEAPAEVKARVGAEGWRGLSLDEEAEATIRRLLAEARAETARPGPASGLTFQRILIELSLEVVRLSEREMAATKGRAGGAREGGKVAAVIAWWMRRLAENPTLEEAAKAHGISVAHLRRRFHAELGRGPREVLEGLRFQRAAEWVQFSNRPLAEIAAATGFSEPAAFSRAFKQRLGVAPSVWRGGRENGASR